MNNRAMKKYIAYYRVSTQRQNLGLEAQRSSVATYIASTGGTLIAEYSEKESGKNNYRVELERAIAQCKKDNATLIIAKLDRLSRNVGFIFQLRDSKIEFCCCDLPELNTLTLGIFATIAQSERETISQRTKAALAVKKANGIKLGSPIATFTDSMRDEAKKVLRNKALSNPNNKRAISMIGTLKEKGYGYKRIADYLNENGFKTAKNCFFKPQTVRQIIVAYM